MKILITGANGQLAKTIEQRNSKHTLIMASKSVINVEDKENVYKKVSEFRPDIVYHFASMTRGDECAADPEKAHRINVVGTKHMAGITAKLGIPILFVSTNEVFDGENTKPYTENDLPNPITTVGENKLEAENIIIKTNPKHYIVRTMWLYSKWSDNFIHAVLRKARQSNSMQFTFDEIGSPTNSLDLADAIEKLVATKEYGIYHITNKGIASRLDFGKEVLDAFDININIVPVKLDEYKRLSKPPHYSALESMKTQNIGITMRGWKSALREFLSTETI